MCSLLFHVLSCLTLLVSLAYNIILFPLSPNCRNLFFAFLSCCSTNKSPAPQVRLKRREDGRAVGFAHVQFAEEAAVATAVAALHNTEFMGRTIQVCARLSVRANGSGSV